MGKYSYYDEKENVIFSKASTDEVTSKSTDEYFDETIEIARNLPQKVFLVVCWKDTTLTPESAQQYSKRIPELLKYIRGIVRYEANDVVARILIRAETVKNNMQKAQPHIYATREEALAAVRKLEQEADKK
jgi:hypothetical protein